MNRRILPEIEDSPRTPAWLRDAMTGYQQVAIRVGRPYAAVLPILTRLLRESGQDRVIDLASGGGGASPARVPFLAAEATHRSSRGLLLTLLISLLVLLLMPRVRPLRPSAVDPHVSVARVPAVIWWDGLAATLKTYQADETATIAVEIEEPGYAWKADEVAVRVSPVPVTMLVGRTVTA